MDKKKISIIRENIEKIVANNYKEDDVKELVSNFYYILVSIVRKVRTRAIEKGGYGKEDVVNIALSVFLRMTKKVSILL